MIPKRMTGKTNAVASFLIALLLSPLSALSAADLTFAGIFTDHAVLQRDAAVPVWGWAAPKEQISVAFGNQTKTATADANGKWLVRLDPMPASAEGRELVVQSATENRKSKITDVVVGDVWLCSGQSNMHFRMNRVENSRKEIAAADNHAVRFFSVEEQFAQRSAANVNGAWKPVSPTTAAECSAVAYYFARALQQKLGVPIGLLVSSVGGTRIETWMQPETLAALGEAGPLFDPWKKVSPEEFENIAAAYRAYQHERDNVHPPAVAASKEQAAPVPPKPQRPARRCHDCPGALHYGMIAPLQPFAIRGVIWYQGEANSGHPAAYEKLLPALIADWRRAWGNELPFLFVQLPPYQGTSPTFREAQSRVWQKTPHTAMIVTTDVGDAKDIHPTRKRPVGERLALAARALSYGERLEYSGPVFDSMSVESNRAVVSFTHAGEGLMAQDGSLKGFTMAGVDGKFIAARAVIQGSTVVVTSDKIDRPVAVRYGWATVPDGNLFNREGLPAAPFRTDAAVAGGKLVLDGKSATMLGKTRNETPVASETPAMPANPPAGWLTYHLAHPGPGTAMPGDPNCAFFWKGRYHLHYIYNDKGFSFAHVSSEDMVHWTWHPTTLTPRTTGHGMFSGTGFITKEGKPAIIYHGQGSGRNQLAFALDDKLEQWSKPAAIMPKEASGEDTKVRQWDPDCWLNGDTYYGISGGGPPHLMKSSDLKTWVSLGLLMHDAMPTTLGVKTNEDVSCANMFKIGNKWMLLCISHKLGCRYYLGDFKDEKFLPGFHAMMNWQGWEFFAPESVLTPDGRRVMWAWCLLKNLPAQSGIQSLPRELSLPEDGVLRIKPLRELETLRHDEKSEANITVASDSVHKLKEIAGDTIEFQATFRPTQARQFGVRVYCDRDGNSGFPITVEPASSTLTLGAMKVPFATKPGEDVTLRVFLDKNMIEVFANDRQAAVAPHTYASENLGVTLFCKGGAVVVKQVTGWKMRSIYEKKGTGS